MDCYDKYGQTLSTEDCGLLLGNREYAVIEKTAVGPYQVSTVWMGLDHSWGTGPPLIFETMVFIKPEKGEEAALPIDTQRRYPTLKDAIDGHAKTIVEVQEAIA